MLIKQYIWLFLVATFGLTFAVESARAADSTLSCSVRRAEMIDSVLSEANLRLTCPDGRVGFLRDETPIQAVNVSTVTSNGQVRDFQLSTDQMVKIFGGWSESGSRTGVSASSLSARYSPDMNLRPEDIKMLKLDPNATGNVSLSIRSLDVSPDAVLMTNLGGQGDIVARPKDGATKPQQCLYVGSMKLIKANKLSLNCAADGDICSAAVECLEPQVGWVTRSAVCKAVAGNCPTNADSCASEQAGLEIGATTSANARQPGSRAKSGAATAVKK